MRASLDAAPQHTRHRHIGAEIGPARDLVDAVGADGPGADYPKCGLIEIADLHPPVVPYEAEPSLHEVLRTLSAANGLPPHRELYIHFPAIRLINNQIVRFPARIKEPSRRLAGPAEHFQTCSLKGRFAVERFRRED